MIVEIPVAAGQDPWPVVLERIAALYVGGVDVDWAAFDRGYGRRKVALPTYPFERERYWVDLPDRDRTPAAATLLYTTEWREKAGSSRPESSSVARGTWIILADEQDRGTALARRLDLRGHRAVLVKAAGEFSRNGNTYGVDPLRPEDYVALWKAVTAADPTPLGVVHLWNLDVEAAGHAIADAALRGTASTMHLMQAMLRQPSPPPLWIVTRGAQPAGGSAAINVAQAPVWGLAATAALEHPELRCVRVDLPPGGDLARDAAALDADATYLVTGGAGALGLQVARTLADAGARHLVLTSRREPSPGALREIEALRAAGARIIVQSADVARIEDVRRVLDVIAAGPFPLRGVVHAAGVIDDAVLMQADTARLARVMAPKVAGALNLHTETRECRLDFFVMFSSIAGVLGSPGQSGYAAANAFLDALAHHRHASGLPASSIAWGPWEQAGLAAGLTSQRRWTDSGIAPLAPVTALGVFRRLLTDGRPSVAVLDVDWTRMGRAMAARADRSFIGDLTGLPALPSGAAGPALRALVDGAPAATRLDVGRRFVTEEVASVLGLSVAAVSDPNKGLQDLGLDSLLALELRERLQRATGAALPSTLAFDYPTIDTLAIHLVERVIGGADGTEPVADRSSEGADLLLRIEDLTDDQVEALLAGQLPADGI